MAFHKVKASPRQRQRQRLEAVESRAWRSTRNSVGNERAAKQHAHALFLGSQVTVPCVRT